MEQPLGRARALAILGLSAEASAEAIRARYRELAKRWHPDHYTGDRTNEVEAAARMRELNQAWQILQLDTPHDVVEELPSGWPDAEDHSSGRRLTEEEKRDLADAVGAWNPVAAGVRAALWVVPLFFAYVLTSGHGDRINPVPPTGGELLGAGGLVVFTAAVFTYQRLRSS